MSLQAQGQFRRVWKKKQNTTKHFVEEIGHIFIENKPRYTGAAWGWIQHWITCLLLDKLIPLMLGGEIKVRQNSGDRKDAGC